jgi:hypothetical protein
MGVSNPVEWSFPIARVIEMLLISDAKNHPNGGDLLFIKGAFSIDRRDRAID